jgi:hypothetical protein
MPPRRPDYHEYLPTLAKEKNTHQSARTQPVMPSFLSTFHHPVGKHARVAGKMWHAPSSFCSSTVTVSPGLKVNEPS